MTFTKKTENHSLFQLTVALLYYYRGKGKHYFGRQLTVPATVSYSIAGSTTSWEDNSYLLNAGKGLTAKSLQSCLTLCNPIDGSLPGSPIPGILQARTLEWVAIFFSNAWKWKVKVKSLSRVRLLATPWTAAHQAPPPMGFSRQEYWSGVPLPSLLFIISFCYRFMK